MYKYIICFLTVLLEGILLHAQTGIWQWSISVHNFSKSPQHPHSKAYLWIPETCNQIRAVIIAQHNMEEISILEDKGFRDQMAKLNIAEVWVCPAFNLTFDFSDGAGETLTGILNDLAKESGYEELKNIPIIGLGHSAAASAPYYMAAYMPERTLACISVSGQWPYFRHPSFAKDIWGNRHIDNIPCLETMGEYESAETWSTEGLKQRKEHPQLALSMLACPAEGHFASSPGKALFLALFIEKALQYGHTDPRYKGWLAEKWSKGKTNSCCPAPVLQYKGNKDEAFWFFDKELAEAAVKYGNRYRGLKWQLLGIKQEGKVVPQQNTHLQLHPAFIPQKDGISFTLEPFFLDTVPSESPRPSSWTGLPAGSPIGHSNDSSSIAMYMICGPATIHGKEFKISWNRGTSWEQTTANITFVVYHPGDEKYRPAVQQAQITIPVRNAEGKEQNINFTQPPNITHLTKQISLQASSSAKMPVSFYVESGPAYIKGNHLFLTPVPPKSRYPIKITVTAWQYGKNKGEKIKTAEPVTRSFYIVK